MLYYFSSTEKYSSFKRENLEKIFSAKAEIQTRWIRSAWQDSHRGKSQQTAVSKTEEKVKYEARQKAFEKQPSPPEKRAIAERALSFDPNPSKVSQNRSDHRLFVCKMCGTPKAAEDMAMYGGPGIDRTRGICRECSKKLD